VVKWSEFLATDPEIRVRFLALPDFLRSNGSGTGFTQPRKYNTTEELLERKKYRPRSRKPRILRADPSR
jgi:hypothetical protein